MSIGSDQFLEVLFYEFGVKQLNLLQIKKQTWLKEKRLLEDIKTLENSLVSKSNMTLFANKQEESENICKQKVKGFITRTHLQWLDEGEKSTSYFCNLEKKIMLKRQGKKSR